MVTNETMRDILYGEKGMLACIRDGKFDEVSEEDMERVIEFSKSFNNGLRAGIFDLKAYAMLIDLMSSIHNMDHDPDFSETFDDFYNTISIEMIRGI